jgi:hypothetical protein
MTASLANLSLLVTPLLIASLASPGGPVSPMGVAPLSSAVVPVESATPFFRDEIEPAALAIVEARPDEFFAMGLASIAKGQYQQGLDQLKQGAADANADIEYEDMAPRLDRAVTRATALLAARNAWIEALGKGGIKLKVPIDGKLKTVAVTGIVEGRIKFQRGFGKVSSWGVDDFDADLLATNLGSKAGDYGETWTRGWAYLLAGNSKWAKYLKGDKKIVNVIKEDADDIESILRAGHGLHAIATLASNAAPTDLASAEKILADINIVRQKAVGTAAFDSRVEVLQALTLRALEVRADATELSDLLSGKVTDLGDGRVRVEYSFDDPSHLDDFQIQTLLMAQRFPKDQTQIEEADSYVKHDKERLAFYGRIGIIHQLQLEGQMSGEFEVTYSDEIGDVAGPFPLIHMGIAATPDGDRRAAVMDFRGSEAVTDKGRIYFYAKDPEPLDSGETYSSQISIDGEVMESSVNGEPFDPFEEIGEAFGAAFVTVQVPQENYLESLAFEGTPRATSMKSLRRHWVSKRMELMGW